MKLAAANGILAVMILLTIHAGCRMQNADLDRVLRQQGITGWAATGRAPGACQEDRYSAGFTGMRQGKRVDGVVCGGFLTPYTVHLFGPVRFGM